jgi:DNA-binding Lrp family transcriptional regulator
MDEISGMPSVMNIYRTEGRYDLMVKVNAETKEMITRIVSNDFRAIQGVDATLTMFIA